MRDILAHRGPDDKGTYVAPGVGFGHRRLSIIDLRPEGRQPMSNEDGSVHIIFNGEIYNFKEHRKWLANRGHHFISRTDTEVIIHLYEEMGTDCVKQMRGMFAFAIWDERKRRLFAARDRVGMKPFYYRYDGSHLIFASELKALLGYPGFESGPDLDVINKYIALGYTPGTRSAVKGVQRLPPGHFLIFSEGNLQIHRYWQLNYLPKLAIEEREACEQIVARLKEAIRLRLVSDVPLGAFLSGGLDSSAVVALMAQLNCSKIKTFSIGFNESSYDERKYAREVAREFGTDHYELTVIPEIAGVLDKLLWHYDEPFADPAAVPTYYLCKMAREHVTVALNGDAGDENFAGYPKYLLSVIANASRATPKSLRSCMGRAALLGSRFFESERMISKRLKALNYILSSDGDLDIPYRMMHFAEEARAELYSTDFSILLEEPSPEIMISDVYKKINADNIIDRSLGTDISVYLPDDLLVKVDIASMAVGLEARSPMVDHEFVEFVARLPARYKISKYTLKAIFKKSLKNILPENIIRRPKMGFGVPLDSWIRGDLSDYVRDVLLSNRHLERGYFNRRAVESLIERHMSGRSNKQYQIWNLLILELWHRLRIDKQANTALLACDKL